MSEVWFRKLGLCYKNHWISDKSFEVVTGKERRTCSKILLSGQDRRLILQVSGLDFGFVARCVTSRLKQICHYGVWAYAVDFA